MRKAISLLLIACMLLALTACGASDSPKTDAPAGDGKVYKVGICQLVQHEALDAATQGFMDKLTELLGEGNVVFDNQKCGDLRHHCQRLCGGWCGSDHGKRHACPSGCRCRHC